MQHYFIDNNEIMKNRKEISFRFLNYDYVFDTVDNIFSKEKIDYGSRLLIETMIKRNVSGKLLDLGSGTGVIGIVLSKNCTIEVTAVDVTTHAIELTRINAQKNNVELEVIKSNGQYVNNCYFDLVAINPPIRAGKKIIYQLFEDSYDSLKVNGSLWIVMRKQHGASSAIEYLMKMFQRVTVVEKSKGFLIIEASK